MPPVGRRDRQAVDPPLAAVVGAQHHAGDLALHVREQEHGRAPLQLPRHLFALSRPCGRNGRPASVHSRCTAS